LELKAAADAVHVPIDQGVVYVFAQDGLARYA
jgi:hypothetical protein